MIDTVPAKIHVTTTRGSPTGGCGVNFDEDCTDDRYSPRQNSCYNHPRVTRGRPTGDTRATRGRNAGDPLVTCGFNI